MSAVGPSPATGPARGDAAAGYPTVVTGRRAVADGVVELELKRPGGTPLPPWAPGAHLDLVLDDTLVRQYSLCGPADDPACYRIAVRKDEAGRGGSRRIHDTLALGDVVVVRGPRNTFPLDPAPGYVFIAGGIGITPLLPMLEAARRAGTEFRLFYGGRSRESMAYREVLAGDHRVRLLPQDEAGPLPVDEILATAPHHWPVYCCGPEPLLAAVEHRCAEEPRRVLRVERFVPRTSAETDADRAFTVELAASGLELAVPADRRLLDVLLEAGVDVMTSCEEGTCGTCETAVLGGVPEHRDSVLTTDEQDAGDRLIVCVSRSRTPRLVLDL
ncbi:PDR/VanB family oxidoreductase [Amycolatopsis rhabdoformis]|uniref:PDR/VanB family oxidoreductase n=1 Tax=Amycolatopsis rhabdoformis TaxID=1448059 RepID=A0ABZ1IKE3_9PSEU|nr:PDR/VanB family oxidoreductase [Amycolatopsis rhabdoformis]WSE34717.1 PDR/VanB family oxidoreductase [Amycolatopsis rhabdoformis]